MVADADLEITNGSAAGLVLKYHGQLFGGYDIHAIQGEVEVGF